MKTTKTVFKEEFEKTLIEGKVGYEDFEGDNSLRNAYYNAADGIYDLESNLAEGNYKNILAEFDKVVKAFQAFDKKVGLGKKL